MNNYVNCNWPLCWNQFCISFMLFMNSIFKLISFPFFYCFYFLLRVTNGRRRIFQNYEQCVEYWKRKKQNCKIKRHTSERSNPPECCLYVEWRCVLLKTVSTWQLIDLMIVFISTSSICLQYTHLIQPVIPSVERDTQKKNMEIAAWTACNRNCIFSVAVFALFAAPSQS